MLFSWSRTPDAVFRLAAALRLVAVATTRGWKASCICIRLYDLRGRVGQRIVRGIANELRDRRAAGRAPHCAQTAQQQSNGWCTTLHTDCTAEVLRIVRGIAHSLCAACAQHCATEERSLCAFADLLAARIGGDSVTHRGPVPGRKRPLFSS